MTQDVSTRKAPWGERTIKMTVRFWTDDIASGSGRIRPKHAWTSGDVALAANDAHGITRRRRKFNSLGELAAVIERLLIEGDVKLHPSTKMGKLISQ